MARVIDRAVLRLLSVFESGVFDSVREFIKDVLQVSIDVTLSECDLCALHSYDSNSKFSLGPPVSPSIPY